MKTLLFLIILFQSIICFSQKEGNIWCFGDSALIDWNDSDNPIIGRSASRSRGSCSSIADSSGNLLFYKSNLSAIGDSCANYGEFAFMYTKDHTIMENGQCLSGEGWYNEHTIVPMPGNDSLYYIFSVDLYNHPGVNYSIVNMKANNGLGKVIERDVSVVDYTGEGGLNPVSSCIKAIRHGNGRDWWLVTKTTPYNLELGPDLFHLLLLLTPDGINVQPFPLEEPYSSGGFTTRGFNKAGTKYYSLCPTNPLGHITIFDFDRCTGTFNNPRIIEEAGSDSTVYSFLFWSAEFSPNSRYLYVNTADAVCFEGGEYYIFQYDLEDEFPALTRDTLLRYELENVNFNKQGGTLRLAPDDKIYYSRPILNCFEYWWPYPDSLYHPWNMNLSVINSPDSAYPACNFTPYSFYLGGARTYYGLPNNPNFALGAIEGSECDTLSTSLGEVVSYKNNQLNIFPNPCYNTCQIQYKPATQKGSIVITNIEGKIIYKENEIPLSLLKYGYEINTSAFAKGVYFVKLIMNNEMITKKMIRL